MLWVVGVRFFGSWPRAIKEADLDYEKVRLRPKRRFPDAPTVVGEIRRRKRKGLPIHLHGVHRSPQKDTALYHSACDFCGSWKQAVEAAGFDYNLIKQKGLGKYSVPENIAKAIRSRKRRSLPLTATGTRLGKDKDTLLYWAGWKTFGSWGKALEYAAEC